MEKTKLLWVAISVGLFLVIVIGASILVFSPRNPVPETTVAAAPIPAGSRGIPGASTIPVNPATVDPADLVRSSEGLPGLQVSPSASAVQENIFYFNGEAGEPQIERSAGNTRTQLTITIPPPASPAAVPAVTVTPAVKAEPRPAPAATTRAASTPAATRSASTAAAATGSSGGSAAPRAASTPAATRTAAPVYDTYWVQTGSFSTRVRADGAKETLAGKGITSIIENRDVEGKIFYRVRVGPYTSQNEADYWLSLVKTINGFEESQVWRSQTRR